MADQRAGAERAAAAKAQRVTYCGREAATLSNEQIVATVEALGGMVPLFGPRRGPGAVNMHWIPDFRGIEATPWSEERHAGYFGAKVLYLLAGEFPCSPTFGAACEVDGVAIPVHGWTATEPWTFEELGTDPESGAAYLRSSLHSPAPGLPLAWEKLDLILPGEPVHYSALRIRNEGPTELTVNLVRHNTAGPPFLEAGCRISLSADRFLAAPRRTEFDATGRLAPEVEFDRLSRAPLRAGGTADLTLVPGVIGATDFVTGAIPAAAPLGWSCVVNPRQALAYACFFPGAAGLPPGEIALAFNDLWLQYGGRSFPPWAFHPGGPDRTFCLGTENGTHLFGNGLAASRAQPELLGRETLVAVPGRGARTLWYATAAFALGPELAAEGIQGVEGEEEHLVLRGPRTSQRVPAAGRFTLPRRVAARRFG